MFFFRNPASSRSLDWSQSQSQTIWYPTVIHPWKSFVYKDRNPTPFPGSKCVGMIQRQTSLIYILWFLSGMCRTGDSSQINSTDPQHSVSKWWRHIIYIWYMFLVRWLKFVTQQVRWYHIHYIYYHINAYKICFDSLILHVRFSY